MPKQHDNQQYRLSGMLYLQNSLRIIVEYLDYTYVTQAFAARADDS